MNFPPYQHIPSLCSQLQQLYSDGLIEDNLDTVAKATQLRLINRQGNTTLHLAAKHGEVRLARFILEKGGDVHCRNTRGNAAIHLAVLEGHVEMVQLLHHAGNSLEDRGEYYNTPLHLAAESGQLEMVQFLLDAGANINARSKFDKSPLALALMSEHRTAVSLLLTRGASFETKSHESWTPLMIAAYKGDKDSTALLLSLGANINERPSRRYGFHVNALEIAVQFKQFDMIDYLLSCGAKVTAGVMFAAAKLANIPLMRQLISKGGDVNACTECRYCSGAYNFPLRDALFAGNEQMFHFLLSQGATMEEYQHYSLLSAAAFGGDKAWQMIPLLLNMGISINTLSPAQGNLLLEYPIYRNEKRVRDLVHWGADIHHADENGYTVLHWACWSGEHALAELLLQHGADPLRKTDFGETAWDLAKKSES